MVWATVLAYLSAMVVYQLGMFGHHPKQSILVLLSVGLFYGAVIKIARYVLKDKFVPVHQEEAQHAVELKELLQQRGHMSVVDMAQCLKRVIGQCRMLLGHWQKHGQVRRLDAVPGCGVPHMSASDVT